MSKKAGIAFLLIVFSVLAFAKKKDFDYQNGQVIDVARADRNSLFLDNHPDLQNEIKYDISIQLGGTIYKCRYNTVKGDDLSYLKGQTLQVFPKGNVMHIKSLEGYKTAASIESRTPVSKP